MTKLKYILLLLLWWSSDINHAFSQGCSDAGFCTINSFKPGSEDSSSQEQNQLKVGAFFGSADNSIAVYGSYFEYNRNLNHKFGLDAKLTTLAQNGNGIATFGLSDIFINANYKSSENLSFTLGAKIPLSDASKTYNDLALPMDYQASLGTTDLIFGLGYVINKIRFTAAMQHPLTQNKNEFISSNYPINSALRSFQSTNNFERKGDVLLRVSYPLSLSSNLKLTPSILPIYHLSNDKFTDEFNNTSEIIGSQGLTLNVNAFLDYKINNKSTVQLNVALPFIVREARPDGLTRSFIANVEYRVKI